MTLPFSVLDLSLVDAGSEAAEALHNSVVVAREAERLGYGRVWFAEHHSSASIASSAPELLIALAARETNRIRVGSGGIMLPNHAPLKVAETFRTLAAFAPGRVDLGLGRAPGTDAMTAYALRRSAEALSADDFPAQLGELLAFEDGFPHDHPFRTIRAVPVGVALPPIYLLGSSGYSAALAAQVGLGFAFAAHINAAGAVPALRGYREWFQPSDRFSAPRAILAVSVVCGDDDRHAEYLASSLDVMIVGLRTGNPQPIVAPDDALARPFTEAEREIARAHRQSRIVGGPKAVRARIEALVAETGADEVMVTTAVYSHAERLRVLGRVAAAFGFTPAEAPVVPATAAD